jgi:uncharacterized protein YndB with AHSA1/START domain
MGRVTATIDLPHPIERVFRVATRVDDLARWMPEVVDAQLLDPALAPGARVRLRLGPGTGNAEITGTVGRLEPPGRLEIGGSGGPLTIRVRTLLAANGDGATRATLEVETSAPPLLGFIAREAERRLQAELPGALQRFRALLDAEPPEPPGSPAAPR